MGMVLRQRPAVLDLRDGHGARRPTAATPTTNLRLDPLLRVRRRSRRPGPAEGAGAGRRATTTSADSGSAAAAGTGPGR